MAISHVFTNPIPDGTNTNIVRPSDWNSAHNQYYTLSGNTLGASTVSGTNVILQAAGNVSLSGTGGTIVISGSNAVVPTSYVSNVNGSSGQISLNVGSSLSSSTNGSSITFGLASNITTALQSANSNYLTTQTVQTQASGNIAGTGFTSTTTAGTAVVGTLNTAGLSLGIPAYLTTAATGGGGVMYANLSGNTSGNTTASGSTLNFSGINVTLSGTNGSQIAISGPATSGISNGNNIAISNTGSTIGISAQAVALGAGSQTATSGTVNFVNSNGVTFGMSGSNQITASVAAAAAMYANLSGNTSGNTTASGSTLNLSGINVTLSGTNGSQIAISAPPVSSLAAGANITISTSGSTISVIGGAAGGIAAAAGTQTGTSGTINFANSNGITFGMSNSSQITASYTVPTALPVYANLSGATTGNTTASGSTLNLSGINVTLSGTNGSQIAISVPPQSGLSNGNNIAISSTGSTIGISAQAAALGAGTQTATSGTVNFVNSNGVTFGMSGSNQITASVAAAAAMYANLSGATSGNTTASGSTLNFSGVNITLSGTNGSQIAISAPATSSLSAGNNISLSSNGSTIGLSAQAVALAGGTQTATSGTVNFANSNNVTFGMSGSNQITASFSQSVQTQASGNIAGTGFTSTTTAGTAVVGTLNTAGLSLGVPAYLTAAAGGGGIAAAAGTQTATSGTVNFANSNGITFGMSGSSQITASYTVPTVPTSYVSNVNGSSGQISLNVGSSLSSSTNGSSITFGLASNITTALQSANANYLTSQSNQAFSASGGSSTFQTLNFANSNGVTFSNSGGSVIASYTVPTVPTAYVSSVNGSSGAISLNVGSSLSSSTNGSSITFGLASNITTALQSAGAYLTTARASNDAVGLNTAQTNVTWTVNSSGLSLNAAGYAGTGTSATNASVTLNSAGLAISVAAPGGGGVMYANLSGNTSGNTTASGSTLNFSGINVTLSGTNGSQIAISAPPVSSLAAGSNITISTTGSTISVIGANYSAGVSNLGNTAGSTGVSGSRIVFVGTNNISLSQSTDSNGATISINQTAGGVGGAMYANLSGATSGNTTASGNTLNFSGVNITLSGTNGSQIAISAPATSSLSAGNNISLSSNGSTIGLSAQAVALIAGTQTATSGTVSFANSNGVTFGMSGSNQITASVAGPYIASGYSPHGDYPLVVGAVGQGTLALDPDIFPDLTVNVIAVPINFSAAANSTGSFTISNWVGLYSRNVSSLSLAHSTSNSVGITFSGTANSASYHGWRNLTYNWSTSISGGRYWIAQVVRTTTGGANCSFSQYLASQINTNFSGGFGVASNATAQFTLGQGFYSASTTALPNAIAFSEIQGTNSLAQRFPIVQFGFNTV